MIRNPFRRRGALDLDERNPFAGRALIGIPPGYATPPKAHLTYEGLSVQNVPIPPLLEVPKNIPTEDEKRLAYDQFLALLEGIWKKEEIYTTPFVAGLIPVKLRNAENRRYLFIQNQSTINNMAIGFNQPPGALAVAPTNGLIIPFNFGFYEPLVIPQGEIWIVAAANATPGFMLYSAVR